MNCDVANDASVAIRWLREVDDKEVSVSARVETSRCTDIQRIPLCTTHHGMLRAAMSRDSLLGPRGDTVLNAYRIAVPAPGSQEVVPHPLNHSQVKRGESLRNAFWAGAGFNQLIAKRGRNGPDDSAVAHGRSRKHRDAKTAGNSRFEVGVAKSTEQLTAADDLIRRRYAWRGYKVESSEDAEPTGKQSDPCHNVTFFALDHGTVVGTITLRLDGPDGLRADATHGHVIGYARDKGRRLGELTRLALAAHVDSRRVLSSLFGVVYSVGRWEHQVTDVFVEVNPRHVAFYVRALGFAAVGDAKFCERVCAPSILLYADVDSLEDRLGGAVPSWPEQLESAQRGSA